MNGSIGVPAPAVARRQVRRWVRTNVARTPVDAAVTLVFGSLAVYIGFGLLRYVLVTGRWEVVRVNLTLLLVGRYPTDELWRVATAVVALVGWSGVVAGRVGARQRRAAATAGTIGRRRSGAGRVRELVGRFWPVIVTVSLLLGLSATVGPWLVVVAAVVAAIVGRAGGRSLGDPLTRAPWGVRAGALLLMAAVPPGLVMFLVAGAGWDVWGGFLINVFIGVAAIVLCFPLGVLLALGRRSRLPVVRLLCTAYIEIFRGSPLFVLLLLAANALEFFVPVSMAPGVVVRAIVVFTLFTAAYLAEIVRGGLQSVPIGQEEAAIALGLTTVRTTFLIVLPQALRNVIPAQIGQFISLFKDVSLAGAAMGVFELLDVGTTITKQPGFAGQRLDVESLAFVALLFWTGSYTLSRESQRLERKLGVGTR